MARAKISTNALTARYCAQQGWPCECVQSWRGQVRHDLFGIADSLILHPSGQIWAQNCSYGTLSDHRRTLGSSPHIDSTHASVQLWEWRKKPVGRRHLYFLRTQTRLQGAWSPESGWSGPFDLYPRKGGH